MKAVTVIFVVPDEWVDSLNQHIESSQLLNEWPVYAWDTTESKTYMDKWYNEEYGEGEEDGE